MASASADSTEPRGEAGYPCRLGESLAQRGRCAFRDCQRCLLVRAHRPQSGLRAGSRPLTWSTAAPAVVRWSLKAWSTPTTAEPRPARARTHVAPYARPREASESSSSAGAHIVYSYVPPAAHTRSVP